jgi:hypothetical protein
LILRFAYVYCASSRLKSSGLFNQKRANRKQRNEIMSRGSLNQVQNVQLATLADSSADGDESRGTF